MKTQIQDEYGEKIGMSRRDMAKLARMSDIGERLAELDGYQREYFFKTATRDFLWPKFDWGKFDPEKHDLGRELFLHQVRKCLPLQCRKRDDESRAAFVRNVSDTMALAEKAAEFLGAPEFDMACGVLFAAVEERWEWEAGRALRMVHECIGFEIRKAELLGFPKFRAPEALDMRSRIVFDEEYDEGRPWCLQRSSDCSFTAYDTTRRRFDTIESLKEYLLGKRKRPAKENRDPKRPQFVKITRKGFFPDTEDIDNEELILRFGLRGYEYGNWLAQEDRRQSLLWAVDSFADLAAAIGIPESAIGNGDLGLGFGSRGNGGRAEAHYEEARNAINLTKMKGAGALAHEWGHYLDLHVMDGHFSADHFIRRFMYREPRNDAERVAAYRRSQAGQDMEKALFTWLRDRKKEEYVKARLHNAANPGEYLEAIREAVQREILEARDNAVAAQSWLDNITARRAQMDSITMETDFYANSRKIGSKYWTDPKELWARAFEYYVHLKMSLADLNNDYLVGLYEGGLAYPPLHEAKLVFMEVERALDIARRSLGVEKREASELAGIMEKLDRLPQDPDFGIEPVEVPENPWDTAPEGREREPDAPDSVYFDDEFEEGEAPVRKQAAKPWFF